MNAKPSAWALVALLLLVALPLAAVAADSPAMPPAAAAADAASVVTATATTTAATTEATETAIAPLGWVASPVCAAGSSPLAPPMLRRPRAKGMDSAICGACSVPKCRGVAENSVCAQTKDGGFLTCQNALDNTCSQDGLDDCLCWSGPFP